MSADADEIGTERFWAERDFHEGLHGIGMKQGRRTSFFQHGGNPWDIRDGAGLVVDEHQGDENGILSQSGTHGIDGNCPGGIRLQTGNLITAFLQQVETAADGIVLRNRADDVVSLPFHQLRAGKQGPVVALRAAGSKNQLLWGTAHRPRNTLAGSVEKFLCLTSDSMG